MLTKDLVRFKRSKQKVRPLFIQTSKKELLELADAMVGIFDNAPGQTRGELSEAVAHLITNTSCSDLVGRGLEKLLLDRTQFDEPSDEEMIRWRHELFQSVNLWMATEKAQSYDDFANGVTGVTGESIEKLRAKIYSDLPEFLPATRFRKIEGQQLLYRYNCALVQWLLLQAKTLKIVLAHQDASHLRQFCKYLRFHQLLADIRQGPGGSYHIHIDGPMSLFHQSQKYGMSLARFFPALLHQPVWRLEAEIHLGKRQRYQLELDHQSGLKPYSHQFHAYIPREILRFETSFKEKVPDWRLKTGSHFLPLAGEQLCFPDYRLVHDSGRSIDLEFFHPWHAAPLKDRLRQLKKTEPAPLLLGVSRKLARDEAIAKQLEKSDYFQNYGLLFSDIPAVRPVHILLKKCLK